MMETTLGIRKKLAGFLKERRIRQYLDFHQSPSDIGSFDSDLRYAIHYPSLELVERQRALVAADPKFYVEEHGTFLALERRFEQMVQCTIDEAAWIVFPFNLGCLYLEDWTEDDQSLFLEEMAVLRSLAFGRPILFFSAFDFAFVRNRTTYPEVVIQPADLFKKFEWQIDTDKILQFESTRDHQSHVPAFPLVSLRPIRPGDRERPFLFSFIGQTTKDHWPKGFIRSSSQRLHWQRLQQEYSEQGFIGTKEQAQRLGFSHPYASVPAKSVFTLCPRGISAWTFRLFESILAGSIPVILSDSYVPPFGEWIPWDSFSLHLPERDLPDIGEILRNIDASTIEDMQARLAGAQHHFTADGLWENLQRYLSQESHFELKPPCIESPALADLGMPIPDNDQRATRRLVNTLAAHEILNSENDSFFELHLEHFLREDRDGPPSNESLLLSCVDSLLQVKGGLPKSEHSRFPKTTQVLKNAARFLDKGTFAHGALIGALSRDHSPREYDGWEAKDWNAHCTENRVNFAISDSLLDEPLLKEVLSQLEMARWKEKSHDGIGQELIACATPTLFLLNYLLNSHGFLSQVEKDFGLDEQSIQYGSGRIYRLRPGQFDYDSWHDDIKEEEGRCVAVVISLSPDGFEGGDWVLREKNSTEELARISLATPGKALLFRVDERLEHRVEPVVGTAPRDVFAGWLRTKPLPDIG